MQARSTGPRGFHCDKESSWPPFQHDSNADGDDDNVDEGATVTTREQQRVYCTIKLKLFLVWKILFHLKSKDDKICFTVTYL